MNSPFQVGLNERGDVDSTLNRLLHLFSNYCLLVCALHTSHVPIDNIQLVNLVSDLSLFQVALAFKPLRILLCSFLEL